MRRISYGVLALVLIIPSSMPAHAQAPGAVTPDPPVIIAQGDSVLMLAPDRAYVQVAAESAAGRLADAQRQAATMMTALETAMKALGQTPDTMRSLSYVAQPAYDGQCYVRHMMEVRVDDLARLASVIDAVGSVKGTSLNGLRFDLKNRGAAELDALKRAVRDATDRANAIAEGAGKSVGAILRMQEQRSSSASPVFRVDAAGGPGGRGGSARPATPIEPGEIQVRATVMLTVAIR